VLLALRIEASRHESATTKTDLGIRSSMIPGWIREPDGEIDSEDREDGSSLPAGDGTAVAEPKLGVSGESGWDSEFSSNSATRSKEDVSSPLSSKHDSTCTSDLVV
jgi:hypothetical protein